MKSRFCLLLTMLLLISITACTSQSGQQNSQLPESTGIEAKSDAAQTPNEQKVELVWSGWSGEEESTRPAIMDMIDSYNALDNGDTVSWVGWPWDETLQQLIIRGQGNEKLDVAQVDAGMFVALAKADLLLDINEIADPEWISKNFEDSALAVGKVDGKQLALPWTLASCGMVYNPQILKEAGVEKIPNTILEFEEALSKIQQYDPEIIPYALCTKDTTCADDFQPWIWTFGGNIFENGESTINNEAGIACLNWYQSLLDRNYIRMNMTRFDARTLFAQGKIAFFDDIISAQATAISNGMDESNIENLIQPMLRPVLNEGDTPQADIWGHMLVIPKSCGNPEAALKFIKFVLEEKAIDYFKSNGMLPVIKSVAKSDAVQQDSWATEYLRITETAKATEVSWYVNNDEMSTILAEEIQAALTKSKTSQQALDNAKERLDRALKK